jgi:hypothetical protein
VFPEEDVFYDSMGRLRPKKAKKDGNQTESAAGCDNLGSKIFRIYQQPI